MTIEQKNTPESTTNAPELSEQKKEQNYNEFMDSREERKSAQTEREQIEMQDRESEQGNIEDTLEKEFALLSLHESKNYIRNPAAREAFDFVIDQMSEVEQKEFASYINNLVNAYEESDSQTSEASLQLNKEEYFAMLIENAIEKTMQKFANAQLEDSDKSEYTKFREEVSSQVNEDVQKGSSESQLKSLDSFFGELDNYNENNSEKVIRSAEEIKNRRLNNERVQKQNPNEEIKRLSRQVLEAVDVYKEVDEGNAVLEMSDYSIESLQELIAIVQKDPETTFSFKSLDESGNVIEETVGTISQLDSNLEN